MCSDIFPRQFSLVVVKASENAGLDFVAAHSARLPVPTPSRVCPESPLLPTSDAALSRGRRWRLGVWNAWSSPSSGGMYRQLLGTRTRPSVTAGRHPQELPSKVLSEAQLQNATVSEKSSLVRALRRGQAHYSKPLLAHYSHRPT